MAIVPCILRVCLKVSSFETIWSREMVELLKEKKNEEVTMIMDHIIFGREHNFVNNRPLTRDNNILAHFPFSLKLSAFNWDKSRFHRDYSFDHRVHRNHYWIRCTSIMSTMEIMSTIRLLWWIVIIKKWIKSKSMCSMKQWSTCTVCK